MANLEKKSRTRKIKKLTLKAFATLFLALLLTHARSKNPSTATAGLVLLIYMGSVFSWLGILFLFQGFRYCDDGAMCAYWCHCMGADYSVGA